jgi:hypothetical protein
VAMCPDVSSLEHLGGCWCRKFCVDAVPLQFRQDSNILGLEF